MLAVKINASHQRATILRVLSGMVVVGSHHPCLFDILLVLKPSVIKYDSTIVLKNPVKTYI